MEGGAGWLRVSYGGTWREKKRKGDFLELHKPVDPTEVYRVVSIA
jgi:hypothetical protein